MEHEHKTAPEHLKWMYSPDPFAARREVEARQDAATKRREEGPSGPHRDNGGAVGGELVGAIEVKMSGDLRELVESVIKKVSPLCRAALLFVVLDICMGEVARFPLGSLWDGVARVHKPPVGDAQDYIRLFETSFIHAGSDNTHAQGS